MFGGGGVRRRSGRQATASPNFKASDTPAGKTFTVTQSLHGPIVGIGLYF
jgi:hypothetical protein